MNAATRRQSIIRSLVFTIVVPGSIAGLIPYLLTDGWQHAGDLFVGSEIVGLSMIAIGLPILLTAIYKFASDGLGTPAPTAPTEHLVISGPHRYVRNPMYIAVALIIVGQALLLGQTPLLWYAAFFAPATAAFVYWYEQPTLTKQFGDDYIRYRAAVRAWIPRITPYRP